MIRGLFVVLFSVLILLSMTVAGISWDLSSSLNYNQVQKQAVNLFPLIDQQLNLTQVLDSNLPAIKQYCVSHSDFVFSYSGYVFDISCADVNSESALINSTIKTFIASMYYKQYGCSYWSCFDSYSTPTFLISQESENYWSQIFYVSLAASALLAAVLLLFVRKKRSLPLLVGGLMILSSLPVFGIGKIISSVSNKTVSGIISLLFSQSSTIFFRMIIAGGIILFIGLVIELFYAGFKIYDMFSKDEKIESKKK